MPQCYCSALHRLLHVYTQIPGDSLTARVRRRQCSSNESWRSKLICLFGSSTPLSMVLATGKVQAMLMLVGILSLAMMLRGMLDVTEGPPRVTCSAVRFSVLSLRNGSMPEDVASPSGFPGSFGVLLNGCKVAAIASEQLMEDCDDAGRHVSERNRRTTQHRRLRQYLTPAAGTQLEFNGISFKTAAQSAAAVDPETFVVECAEENGMDFKLVAASGICGWFPTSGHHISLSAAQGKLPSAQIPLKREKVVKWDYTATRCLQVRRNPYGCTFKR